MIAFDKRYVRPLTPLENLAAWARAREWLHNWQRVTMLPKGKQ